MSALDTGSSLSVRVEEGVAWLSFQRPAAANAIDLETATQFSAAAERLAADITVRVVVITGNETAFCAGGDVASMLEHGDREAYLRDLAGTMRRGVSAFATSRLVVVAAVQGVAAGAGFALALDADLVIATPTASFVSAYTQVGLTPDTGFSAHVVDVVGRHRANELVLLNRRLDATTARDWGIVNEIVPSDGFEARVGEIAAQLASAAQPATAEAKRLLTVSKSHDLVEQLDDEVDTISRVVGSADATARIEAFARRSESKRSTT